MSALIWSLSFFWAALALAMARFAAALLRCSWAKSRFCWRELLGDPLLEPLEGGPRGVEVGQALVEGSLGGGRLLAEIVGPRTRVEGRLVELGERLLVLGDLDRKRLVLLADVEVLAHLGQQVGEGAARQERFEERRAIGVIGAAEAVGQEGLALGEFGPLGRLLRFDADELAVEGRELLDESVVVLLDRRDLGLHALDLDLDRVQVGVDALELVGGLLDAVGQARLERVQLGDLRLLRRDVLLELFLLGLRVGQLVAADDPGGRRRGGHAEQPDHQREEEKECPQPSAEGPSRRCRSVGAAPPAGGWNVRLIGLVALHVGDVIVRALLRVRLDLSVDTVMPAGESPSEVTRTLDDTGCGHDTREV